MRSCSAPYCNNSKSKCRDKPFFSFPRDEKLCLQWVHACRCPDLFRKSHGQLYHNCCLCGDHFAKHCIIKGKVKRLIAGAVPTVFSEAGTDEKIKKRLSSEEWKDFCSREQFKQKLRLSMLTLLYNDEHSSIGTMQTDSSPLQEELNTKDQGTSEIAEARVSDITPDPDAGVSILSDMHSEKSVDLDVVKKERCSDDSSYEVYDVSDDEMAESRAGSDTPSRPHIKEDIEMSIKNEGRECSASERNCVTPDDDDEAHTAKREAEEEISTGPCFKQFKESLKLSMQCILKREECSDSGSHGNPNDNSINETSVSFTKETNMDDVASANDEVKPGGATEMQFKQNLERRLKSIVSKDLKISAQERMIRGLRTKLRNLREKMRDHEQKCIQKSFLLSQLRLHLPPNLYTLLLSQIEATAVPEKDRRWSRDFKSWAIDIYQASPKAYEVCQRLLYLPSIASMSRYVQVYESASESSG